MAVPPANRTRIPQHAPLKPRGEVEEAFEQAPASEFQEPPPAPLNIKFFLGFMVALAAVVVVLLGLKK